METSVWMIGGAHVILCAIALYRIWGRRGKDVEGDTQLGKIIWTIMAVVGVIIGPVFAMGFAPEPMRHDDPYPPERWM